MNGTIRDENKRDRVAYAEAEIARTIKRIQEENMSRYLCQVEELAREVGRRGYIGGCRM